MKKIILFLLLILPFVTTAQEVYHIKFISNNVHHSVGLIWYDDNTGKMRVRYTNTNGEHLVEMDVLVKEIADGFVFFGSNAIDTATSQKANYYPDNFYVMLEDSDFVCINKDDGGSSTNCCIMEVLGEANQAIFLEEFNWKFN